MTVAILEEKLSIVEKELAEARRERDEAVRMLASWCLAVDEGGAGWDYWDENYKDARWRPCSLRALIDAAIDAARKDEA